MADQIGKVTHYYDKIGVAVIKLEGGDLKVGDTVKLDGKDGKEFSQTVSSMQIEHSNIEIAKAGDEFGLKTDSPVKENSAVVKEK
ncbi:hypothetical protein HYW39_02600 [Candidatus Curtissbacteria bacterium]|nr:hypothetical protein [Candidatus Curtissbacteria bacterium]